MDSYNFLWRRDEEEEEELGVSRAPSLADSLGRIEGRMGEDYERSFMERVFAPFEAPQQFLFSLTREIADDGFQSSDLWGAISHGANYFNPFGNTRRIEEDEIRQVFFGPDGEDAKRTLATSGINLAISLLYDPLWFVPVAGAAKKAGLLSPIAAGTIQRIADPGMAAMDLASMGLRGLGKVAKTGATAVAGAERVDNFTTKIMQWFSNKYYGLDDLAKEQLGKYQMRVNQWQQEATQLYMEGRKLSPDTQRLVTKMIESDAVYTSRYLPEVQLRPRQKVEIDNLLQEAASLGISEDLLFETYQGVQKLEMRLADDLLRTGRITKEEHAEFFGRHIRRTYTVLDDPRTGLERVERLLASTDPAVQEYAKDSFMFDRSALRKSLLDLADNFTDRFPTAPASRSIPMGGTEAARARARSATRGASREASTNARFLNAEGVRDYFPMDPATKARRFDADTFLTDFGYFLNDNPMASIDEAMDFVRKEMFQGHTPTPKMMEVLGNYMSNGQVKTMGLESWRERFLDWKPKSAVDFRSYREHAERVAEREAIPEFIRRELLGQPDTYLPGLIDDAVVAAREVEITELFDTFSEARRLDPALTQTLRQAAQAGGDDAVGNVAATLIAEGVDPTDARNMAKKFVEGSMGEGDLLNTAVDSRWSSKRKTDIHTYQLPDDPTLGSMAGRYVSPGLAAHLQNYSRLLSATPPGKPEALMARIMDGASALTSEFKFLKIPADIGANVRDTIGSIFQMDMIGGVPFRVNNLKKSMNAVVRWANGETNEYVDAARRIGYDLIGNGFTATELRSLTRRQVKVPFDVTDKNWFEQMTSAFGRVTEVVGEGKRNWAQLYQMRENFLRTYVFSSKYDELLERAVAAGTERTPALIDNIARQAAALTDRSLFNYADVPYAVEFARKYGIAPFITFPFKAVPQLVDSLYNNPLRVLKYDRAINNWNDHWAGGPDAFAAEVAALPKHKRDAMVIRLPGEDVDGNPLYLDMSYFLPWFAVRDLSRDLSDPLNIFSDPANDVEEQRGAIAGDTGMRSNIFTPVAWQLVQAFANNQDGLGRPIVDPTDSPESKFKKMGRFLYQFMAPPTFVGGTTADSVGRAMQAVARTSPEPMPWVDLIGTSMRTGFNQGNEDALNRRNERPTTRALVGQDEGQAATLANSLGSLFLNVSASDPVRQARNERIETELSNTEIQRKIAQVRANRNLPLAEKREEIERLREMLRRNREAAQANILAMRQ